ncbi:nitroreductase/quinone reductase family protein [Kribbella sp. NPDC051770]|uniref:nitroreductase/quinone reductase family protein n=1 Tax=Kribbella sp. NPDC051770 TaxID=3155413 RepID=UPI003425C919
MLNDQIIAEFRANQGQVGGPFEGARLLLLTTKGARSGRPHTAVLGYYPDTDGRVLVVGSAGGGPKHPDWFHNLLAFPRATVESGAFTYDAEATVLAGAERDETFARLVEADAGWGEYQRRTTRTIPVVVLTPVEAGPPVLASGSPTFGEFLVAIHTTFRRELALIRREVATSGSALGAQLRINCLSVCQGLHNHHTGESTGIFPVLLDRYPELTAEITALQADHDKIALLLDELQELVRGGRSADVLGEVDRLIEELTTHLDTEEAILIPLL